MFGPFSVSIGFPNAQGKLKAQTHEPTEEMSTRINSKEIRFACPDISVQERFRVSEVLQSNWLTNGPKVREFEAKVASMSGCNRAVAMDSCTAAMELTLRALGIGSGDEVITTPYTYSATAEVIRNVGATIVFVDLDGSSFEMDYHKLYESITERTKAIIPVDIGGKICDYQSIYNAVEGKMTMFKPSNGIQSAFGRPVVIADAAHSFGANAQGFKSGQSADFTCFSFHVLKNITTGGEGGAVVWNDNTVSFDSDSFERTLRLLADHGQTSRDKTIGWEYDIEVFGYNSIMTDVDAAMGIEQLRRHKELTEKRIHITKTYDRLFKDVHGVIPLVQHIGSDYQSAMHLYPLALPKRRSRDKIFAFLRDNGIPCNVHYKPLPMMTAYKNIGFDINDYPNAYEMFKHVLTIPYHTMLTGSQQEFIVETIKKAVSNK